MTKYYGLIDLDACAFMTASAIEKQYYHLLDVNGKKIKTDFEKVSEVKEWIDEYGLENTQIECYQHTGSFNSYTKTLKQYISNIYDEANLYAHQLYVEKPSSKCFRFPLAVSKPYKGKRSNPLYPRPLLLNKLKEWGVDNLSAIAVSKIETDDALAIKQSKRVDKDSIICCNDKDLLMVQGNHFRLHRDHRDHIRTEGFGEIFLKNNNKDLGGTGNKFFFAQMLIGDKADNYDGLVGCGVKSKWISELMTCDSYKQGLELVIAAYKDKFGDDWYEPLLEQGRLAWMLREPYRKSEANLWHYDPYSGFGKRNKEWLI